MKLSVEVWHFVIDLIPADVRFEIMMDPTEELVKRMWDNGYYELVASKNFEMGADLTSKEVSDYISESDMPHVPERMFSMTNSIDDAWYNPELARDYGMKVVMVSRSTSVGDLVVMTVEGDKPQAFVCACIGFKKVNV